MIRRAIIAVLTISALAAFVLTVASFRVDFITQSGYPVYGWNPGGIAVTKKCMLFVNADRGELRVAGHHYIAPSRKVSRVSLDWWVVAYEWFALTLPPKTVERDRSRGREATSQRLAWHATVQLWLLFVLFSAYPATVFVRGPLRRYRRQRRGLCLKCGYNLTGNVTGVCPECGKAA
jgi:hypothetical protein